MDFQSFYSGSLFHAYKYLGAHSYEKGFVFRVYAPSAFSVSVIGQFSDWKELPMAKIYDGQFYELYVEGAKAGQLYKIRVYRSPSSFIDHSDPYAFYSEKRPGTASILYDFNYLFSDDDWMHSRCDFKTKPLNIYEIHAGSWIRKKPWSGHEDPAEGWVNYRELADAVVPYLLEHGYNALEIMPLAEHPADESWGYQETGFFSATSRYGKPEDLQYLVDLCHKNSIAVILDVVTVHFAPNDYALWNFDGTALYEYPHPAVGYSEWGSCNFCHSRGDVRSFLVSSCAFWLDLYHFDGLRFDAVGNLIYWQGNRERGVNAEAVRFMQDMNRGLKKLYPSVMLIAEDSTPYSSTTASVEDGGLGFDYKWDLGWMNDTLRFFSEKPSERVNHMGEILFSMDYFFNSRYLLPFSHDEVVHGKKTIEEKISGNFEERLVQLRLLYLYMYTHPGKKLNFMGNEFAATREWDERRQLDWESLNDKKHSSFRSFMDSLNSFYLENEALSATDYDRDSFRWVETSSMAPGVLAFERLSENQKLLVVLNFSDSKADLGELLKISYSPVFETYACEDSKEVLGPFQGRVFEV